MGFAIVVVGSLNMDLVAQVEKLPETGQTVPGSSFATYPGGKGANQAVAAAKLGGQVIMAGCVGQDAFGKELMDSLADSRVNTQHVRKTDQVTGTALITVAEDGKNTIVVVPGANAITCSRDVDAALQAVRDPGILLLQHEISSETVAYAIKTAKAAGWRVMVNPAPARLITDTLYPLIDFLTPNETEAAMLSGVAITSREQAKQAAKVLLAKGVQNVIITLGEQGALWATKEKQGFVEPVFVQAVDTTAAGDAFSGALAAGLSEEKTLSQALEFASYAAAIAVTRPGAQPALATTSEVEQLMEKRGIKR
ncbi:ribokinase [Sporomusaceae bacterium BoRhaA]|uniref:ribokinase n=1 Tax=Pelorhabdus rhamnosifermentans TaxID=2772457 RepID=UPI001C063AE7|nr:ribokinase [Pelorhabdus rhamnosifermentans]MBU2702229.1 ribokinase [Pelorhabdus rhamnosifermentans]